MPNKVDKYNMTQGSEWWSILKFIFPIFLGNVFQQGYNIADRVIVGRFLGAESLAAVGSSSQVMAFMVSVVMGFTMGASILIAQYAGVRDEGRIRKTIGTTYSILLVMSVFVTAGGLIWGRKLLIAMNTPPEILESALVYLRVVFWGTLARFGYNATAAILRGLGDAKTPLLFLILSAIINIVFDIIFVRIFGWGVAGVAWSTFISEAFAFLLGFYYLARKNKRSSIKNIVFDWSEFKKIICLGAPSGVQRTAISLGMFYMQSLINSFGTPVIAGYTGAIAIENIIFSPVFDFSLAISTFTGQNIQNPVRVRRGFWYTILMTSCVTIMVTVIILLFARPMLHWFIKDKASGEEAIEQGILYLRVVAPFYILAACQFVATGLFRSSGDTVISMVLTMMGTLIVRVPTAFLLSRALGVAGAWWALPIAWGFGFGASLWYYTSGKWKGKTVLSV